MTTPSLFTPHSICIKRKRDHDEPPHTLVVLDHPTTARYSRLIKKPNLAAHRPAAFSPHSTPRVFDLKRRTSRATTANQTALATFVERSAAHAHVPHTHHAAPPPPPPPRPLKRPSRQPGARRIVMPPNAYTDAKSLALIKAMQLAAAEVEAADVDAKIPAPTEAMRLTALGEDAGVAGVNFQALVEAMRFAGLGEDEGVDAKAPAARPSVVPPTLSPSASRDTHRRRVEANNAAATAVAANHHDNHHSTDDDDDDDDDSTYVYDTYVLADPTSAPISSYVPAEGVGYLVIDAKDADTWTTYQRAADATDHAHALGNADGTGDGGAAASDSDDENAETHYAADYPEMETGSDGGDADDDADDADGEDEDVAAWSDEESAAARKKAAAWKRWLAGRGIDDDDADADEEADGDVMMR